ncbi:RNA polymerase sigma factor [Aquimarina brevivitae]|uniref:RNA polymerase sigma factor (Sigma-70 family) n=1 Tax=Aquimarina brevivitae TaxID=323412 RepID=A0A4Q7P050_9FLAO|nr:sigma-70 family RNA polymerase sigma factor [Aquimarina brevivitae]RZS93151.1 RNA polymerase sigma factor (sigma-70 family) [Aquimarina brevivitae]
MSDNESLLNDVANGDKIALQRLYTVVFPKIHSFVLKNKGKQEDAEDVFQKALMQIIARYKVKGLSIESSFEAFLFTACRNLWRRELNKRKKVVTNQEVVELYNEAEDMTAATLEQEKWELFQEKLLELSENCKTLLKLFFKKTPYKDIVKQLRYNSDNVVRQRIFNCKSQLTKMITNDVRFKHLKEL